MDIGPPELILILVAVLVLFGGAQLPKLARNLGKAQQEFKKGLSAGQADADDDEAVVEPSTTDDKSATDHPT